MTVIGMLECRMTVNYIAVAFGVHRTTIWRLAQRFRTTGTAKNRPRSGRPTRLTPREERYIRVRISAQAVRNNLKLVVSNQKYHI